MRDLFQDLPDRLKAIYPKDLFKKLARAHHELVFEYLTLSPEDFPQDYLAFRARQAGLLRTLQEAGVAAQDGRLTSKALGGSEPLSELPVASGGPNDYDFDHLQVDCPIAVDLGVTSVAEGRKLWGNRYLEMPDGQHGPAKFDTHEEKRLWMRLSGHREKRVY